MSDRIAVYLFGIIIVFMVVIAFITADGYFDCRDDDGKYVRGLFMYECVERNE